MEKKSKIGSFISGAGKAARDLLDKSKELAVKVTDQNDDGKFDMEDVSAIASSVSDAVKNKLQNIKDINEKRKLEKEFAELRPIFRDADTGEFRVPKFFRVVERDKRRAESELCAGSIGYCSQAKGQELVNLFDDVIEELGIAFDKVGEKDFYLRNPVEQDRYICLKEYFNFLKTARIMELTMIAQELGAKQFEVTYIDQEKTATARSFKASAKTGGIGSANVGKESMQSTSSDLEIAAKQSFPGHDPIEPKLKYLAKEPYVRNLINLRMNATSPLQEQVFKLRMSDSIGITEKEAAGIDAMVSGVKTASSFSMSQQLRSETMRFLEYHIEF